VALTVIVGLGLLIVSMALAAHDFTPRVDLMLRLLRVMFPYMFFVCLAAVFIGILNTRGHFFIPAMGATMLNVVMIASVFLLTPVWPGEKADKVFALAVGVVVAGVAQALFQLPSLRREGFNYRWVSPWRNETVRNVVRKIIPGTIGVAAFQINVLVVQNLGLVLGSANGPIISPFNYAVRLMELPQGVFGISLATYLLPALAGLAAEKKFDEFRATIRHGIEHLLFVNVLCAALLIVLAEPAVRLIFERGNFTAQSTHATALALQWLSASLIGYSLVNIFARAFYALGDTRTPMKISVVCLVVNLVCAVVLVFPLKQGGFGLANTISSTLNCGLLLFALRKKLKTLGLAALRPGLLALVVAVAIAGLTAWGASHEWERLIGHVGLLARIGAVFVPGTLAAGIYFGIALAAKIPAAVELRELWRRRR